MDLQRIERVRKRKADDEDELMFFIFPALYVHLSKVEKNYKTPLLPIWQSESAGTP